MAPLFSHPRFPRFKLFAVVSLCLCVYVCLYVPLPRQIAARNPRIEEAKEGKKKLFGSDVGAEEGSGGWCVPTSFL